MPILNQTEYGRMIGVSRQRIAAYIASGHISRDALVKHGKRMLIDSDIADGDLKRSLDPAQVIKAKPGKARTISSRESDVQAWGDRFMKALTELHVLADVLKEPCKAAVRFHLLGIQAFFIGEE